MPMMKAEKDEKKEDFISRFMGDESMTKEYPDEKQRAAVAYQAWEDKDKEQKQNNTAFNCVNEYRHNISPLVRAVNKEGIEYLVAPVVMMPCQCVMNKVLYLNDATIASAEEWNGKPVVVYHPDEQESASTEKTYTTKNIGVLLNAKIEDSKLKAEAWIEVHKVNNLRLGKLFMQKLKNNENMDVSTGMRIGGYHENGEYSGKPYEIVANEIKPDHLAVLPNMKGASSWEDGAGFARNNEENNDYALKSEHSHKSNNKEEFQSMERKQKIDELIKGGLFAENQRKGLEEIDVNIFDSIVKNAEKKVEAEQTVQVQNAEKSAMQKEIDELKEFRANVEKKEKSGMVAKIVDNKDNSFTEDELYAMNADLLGKLAKLADSSKQADFSGMGGAGTVKVNADARAAELEKEFNKE